MKKPNFFITVSPLPAEAGTTRRVVKKLFKPETSIVTEEQGSNGTHPHWHILTYSDIKNTYELTKKVKRHMVAKNVTCDSHNFCVTKPIGDFQDRLDYLSKEDPTNWIHVKPKLQKYQDQRGLDGKNKFRGKHAWTTHQWSKIITKPEFPHFAIWFMKKNDLDPKKIVGPELIYDMTKAGYYVGNIIPQWKSLWLITLSLCTPLEFIAGQLSSDYLTRTFRFSEPPF